MLKYGKVGLWSGIAFLSIGLGMPAQTAEKLPTYDVATVRPSTAANDNSSIWTQDATFRTENVPLRDLLQQAFGVPRNVIFGLPGWAESARFDINAKILDPDMGILKKLKAEQRRAMLLALYEERFGLRWHFETRVMTTYELVLAREGSKLEAAAGTGDHDSMSMNNSDLTAKGVPVSSLTQVLAAETERPVVDKTGLAGKYDFRLKWTREAGAGSADAGKDADAPPALFTALQEQLGLKLQTGKDPVEVVVIDRIEAPSAN